MGTCQRSLPLPGCPLQGLKAEQARLCVGLRLRKLTVSILNGHLAGTFIMLMEPVQKTSTNSASFIPICPKIRNQNSISIANPTNIRFKSIGVLAASVLAKALTRFALHLRSVQMSAIDKKKNVITLRKFVSVPYAKSSHVYKYFFCEIK